MAQRTVIKDGVVVNVIELGDDTTVCTKGEHKEALRSEEGEYRTALQDWRLALRIRQGEVDEQRSKASMALATAEALKTQAKATFNEKASAVLLKQILRAEEEAKAFMGEAAKIAQRPLPPKPKPAQPKRYFHPDGLEIGPPGGDIGDLWDGSKYSKPEKAKAA